MTKYYYNNQLVRTSKTHLNYTHAVVREIDGKICTYACSSSKENASKRLNEIYNYNYGSVIETIKEKINAMENGRNYFFAKEGKTTFKVQIKDTDNLEKEYEDLKELIANGRKFIEETSVVELEVR